MNNDDDSDDGDAEKGHDDHKSYTKLIVLYR
jgi:hypothetical protein